MAGHRCSDGSTDGKEMTMRGIASMLMALSVLAAAATSVGAQTREDEVKRDFWQEYYYKNPPN
jgi:hypothetical protein